jgi:hypothetical protein
MVACLRLVIFGKVITEVRTFQTTTADLLRLSEWLATNDCTHVAMGATGVYWKPVWHILDDGEFELVLANVAHVKNVPGRKTDVNDANVAGGTVGARSDPGKLRAGRPDPGGCSLAQSHSAAVRLGSGKKERLLPRLCWIAHARRRDLARFDGSRDRASMMFQSCFLAVETKERISAKSIAPCNDRKPPEIFCRSFIMRPSRSA